MLLLATDTSGKNGSIALARCDGEACEVLEIVPLVGGTFSAQLVPQVAGLLAKHGFTKSDLGGFAVASGPGSFTGLRVGLAAIKALAEVLEKPIAAVSLLEAVARSAQLEGNILAALDAGRNEVYLGEYQIRGSSGEARCEWLSNREECFASAAQKIIVTPYTSIAEEARARGLEVKLVEHPGSDLIAKIGWQKIRSGKTVSPQELDANYIRRSDAEIFAPNKS
jgi:tRNA threonylcarbamoyladenosine biosynthesis protein TsaB